MQIVIPMSGFGERFRVAGYNSPKPLIEIDGKPIIGYVIEMFPGETNFLFICNEEHLLNPTYRMREIILKYCPTGKIIGIPSHKLGPVYAILQAKNFIELNERIVVNYCDFTCYWDWEHFKKWTEASKCVGAVPAYKGFHPHSLGDTNYAYIQVKSEWIHDIQEKKPFTDNRIEEYASSGTYYFSSGRIMLDSFEKMVENHMEINGEYYVSLSYKNILQRNKSVAVYEIQHFMQWGTPEDVEEYLQWSSIFRSLNEKKRKTYLDGAIIIPMAGLGKRFSIEGYNLSKPLIPVSGKPMVMQAIDDLPVAKKYVFVLRSNMTGYEEISTKLLNSYSNSIVKTIDNLTDGQACTALLGLEALNLVNNFKPVTFGSCDSGSLYNFSKLSSLIFGDADVIVWAKKRHPHAIRNPNMYGWIKTNGNKILKISVKKPLNSLLNDPVAIGTFTFKNGNIFRMCVEKLINQNVRVNGEFYIDSSINMAIESGMKCVIFEVDHLISWGTPDDLRTFEYWQSCFNKWSGHPYCLDNDINIPQSELSYLLKKYEKKLPQCLYK